MNQVRKIRQLVRSTHPETRGIVEQETDGPVFKGAGTWNYICPDCGRVLAEAVDEYLPILNATIKCGGCGTLSDVPTKP